MPKATTSRSYRTLTLLLGLALALTPCAAPAAAAVHGPDASLLQRPPQQWVREAVDVELKALDHKGPYLRYRLHVVNHRGDQVRDEIETPEGTVARLILRDGHPLSPDEDAAERARLNTLIDEPDDFSKHIRNDRSERKTAGDLIQNLPNAMLYTYVAGQPQIAGASGQQVVLDFEPNPQWSPPTTAAQVLTGLRGRLWIDADTHAAVRLQGTVFRPVNVGWGMIAHLYPGGSFSVSQKYPAPSQHLMYTHYEQDLTVRALLVKSLDIRAKVDTSDIRPVAQMGYADAIRLLLNTPLPKQ